MYFRCFRSLYKNYSKKNLKLSKSNYLAGELLRNTHSLEKGLSIENPKLGFGHRKQAEMIEQIIYLSQSQSTYYQEVCGMAMCALNEYLDYHFRYDYSDDFCEKLSLFLEKYKYLFPKDKTGGILSLKKTEMIFDVPAIEKFFYTRHSIRDFERSEVDIEKLKQALRLAQKAPSACNRQGVRTYIIDKNKNENFAKKLAGVGGFAEVIDKFVLVTGKVSSYRFEEDGQYIVSASMYAAYLTLTLHLYGLGGCVINRPVIWTAEWEMEREKLGIPKDEQCICLVAVGNLKQSCIVPLSHRLQNDEMIQFL